MAIAAPQPTAEAQVQPKIIPQLGPECVFPGEQRANE